MPAALLSSFATLGLAACTPSADTGKNNQAVATASTAAPSAARVFFVDLQDGARVTGPVELQFGAEGFKIEPAGTGFVHPGAGHFHLGVDTECLPAGILIPTADPWIHFGDGSNNIELDLSPGQHRLALQIGDGEHRTLPESGLCKVILITVEEDEAAP